MTDNLAMALQAAGYQRVQRRQPTLKTVEKTIDRNAALAAENDMLRKRVVHLEAENLKLMQRLGAAQQTMTAIKKAVAKKRGVKVKDMESGRRFKSLVLARHEAMWEIHRTTGASYPEIGRAFGDRDHSSVIHGVKKHQARVNAGEVE